MHSKVGSSMNSFMGTCPLCKSDSIKVFSKVMDVEYFSLDGWFQYLECVDCKSVFLENPPTEKLEIIYPSNYYSVEGANQRNYRLHMLLLKAKEYLDTRLFKSCLKLATPPSISCLDVGGGNGWLMNLLKNSSKRVSRTVIFDLNESSRADAELNGHEFICGKIESIDIKEEFDFVLMLNLIEHVENPGLVLSLINRSMKSEGLLLVKTPNTLSLNRMLFRNGYWGGCHAPRHWILFNKVSFTELAERCGFSVVKFKYTQGAWQWTASVLGTYRQRSDFKGSRLPMHQMPFASILILMFGIVDFLLLPIMKTDQMFFLLQKNTKD